MQYNNEMEFVQQKKNINKLHNEWWHTSEGSHLFRKRETARARECEMKKSLQKRLNENIQEGYKIGLECV